MSKPVLILRDLTRSYAAVTVLKGVNFTLEAGEMVGLIAPSGAGKSTLLHMAGLLDRPTSGEIEIGGRLAARLNDTERTELRRRTIGFVYQFHQLLPEFSALENVALPQMMAGIGRKAASVRAAELLTMVGLEDRLAHRPATLSGGEQQRVAIVRAIANRPKLLLADEPTGNLDPATAESVFAELLRLVRTTGLAALIATHNLALAQRMDRIVTLQKGAIAAA